MYKRYICRTGVSHFHVWKNLCTEWLPYLGYCFVLQLTILEMCNTKRWAPHSEKSTCHRDWEPTAYPAAHSAVIWRSRVVNARFKTVCKRPPAKSGQHKHNDCFTSWCSCHRYRESHDWSGQQQKKREKAIRQRSWTTSRWNMHCSLCLYYSIENAKTEQVVVTRSLCMYVCMYTCMHVPWYSQKQCSAPNLVNLPIWWIVANLRPNICSSLLRCRKPKSLPVRNLLHISEHRINGQLYQVRSMRG